MKSRPVKWLSGSFLFLVALYLLLLLPGPAPPNLPGDTQASFAWNRDAYWTALESRFRDMRSARCDTLDPILSRAFSDLDSLLFKMQDDTLSPQSPLFRQIENHFFELATILAACPQRISDYIGSFSRLRTLVKNRSLDWDMNSRPARDCIYRLLYGGRTALEEVMQQVTDTIVAEVMVDNNEPSATPAARLRGVTVHSGDILVSRGGAPTSALIARGNDYPGNFSHAALVHIDPNSGGVSIIESHIEKGVAVATVDEYLKDTKLRIMVLRLRADLPFMSADPMLPHKAASQALQRARTEHIPYDFTMDIADNSRLFCSEVVSAAYRQVGITLWIGLSHISSPGIKSWLAAFGVRHFTTQEPSDLEYDPQLRVVAEWRDRETLRKDRLDNATVDIMLEKADRGARLDYDWYLLPVGRFAKLYSTLLNQFRAVGPVPEGMDATAALRNKWFSRRHEKIKQKLAISAELFRKEKGYPPPYWELIKLARSAAGEF